MHPATENLESDSIQCRNNYSKNAIQKRNLTSPSKKLADLTSQNFNEEESFEILKILNTSAPDCPYLDY